MCVLFESETLIAGPIPNCWRNAVIFVGYIPILSWLNSQFRPKIHQFRGRFCRHIFACWVCKCCSGCLPLAAKCMQDGASVGAAQIAAGWERRANFRFQIFRKVMSQAEKDKETWESYSLLCNLFKDVFFHATATNWQLEFPSWSSHDFSNFGRVQSLEKKHILHQWASYTNRTEFQSVTFLQWA